MPEKPLTVATYAAGASLAAITLFYVFAPNYFLDGDSNSTRKKGVVGLSNPANDCFINSVLQALAGLTDLRIYLIRETHRRNIDEPWVYQEIVQDPAYKSKPEWKVQGLQAGLVTKGLKDILDALNERPIYKKTISAGPFIRVLETAFKQRISRQQQDAQEFLQVVAERLCDEYHAGRRARQAARNKCGAEASANKAEPIDGDAVEQRLAKLAINGNGNIDTAGPEESEPEVEAQGLPSRNEEDGFPMEGKYESQIECQKCSFKPKPTENTFCTLTLNVPQSSSTSLNACLDGFFKTEYIDDFKCDKCRLVHAKDVLETQLSRSNSESFKASTQQAIAKLQHAIDSDPENPPPDVELPPMRDAPACKIAKHTRLTGFPKIMAVHLSRSIYNSISQKNSAKVTFPEQLLMGTLLNRKKYKLLATVTHKGSHHSGHYESFRRQNISLPFSTPNAFQASDIFAKSATPSPASTPRVSAIARSGDPSPIASTPDLGFSSSGSSSSNHSVDVLPRPSTDSTPQSSATSNGRHSSRRSPKFSSLKDRESDTISLKSVAASARSTMSRISHSARNSRPSSPASQIPVAPSTANGKAITSKVNGAKPKRRKQTDRWWRISDEKIKEAKTGEVLGMQREVYLLFYELERESPAES
ncbi:Ubiquitin carboxyl-terminal hydrolase 16 [Daldinia childiae]|uniref:Ubiquitin carboxyl-terminal hydrolase 16 n=1 Tax=Daldinia childiae TaxID=326645 RepID=UPI0014481F27|nr:Ubiquitin carboxyl-terminal hydrolase 16 [Daldinia childiae]KAF3061177.1 Ubiquitin carboxyl-terminal hydrolase 16 [Daldinia childiae]